MSDSNYEENEGLEWDSFTPDIEPTTEQVCQDSFHSVLEECVTNSDSDSSQGECQAIGGVDVSFEGFTSTCNLSQSSSKIKKSEIVTPEVSPIKTRSYTARHGLPVQTFETKGERETKPFHKPQRVVKRKQTYKGRSKVENKSTNMVLTTA